MATSPGGAGFHFERALFVIGDQDTGKSAQLRHIFQDVRFHRNGEVPTGADAPRLSEMYRISNERALYLRLTSPHEMKETVKEFLDKTEDKISRNLNLGRRWNFAGSLQPTAANNMPSAAAAIVAFMQRFHPERARAVFLNPDRHGGAHVQAFLSGETDQLWNAGAEVIVVDARRRDANGLVLADFFDFT
jgi:hypothetical protein